MLNIFRASDLDAYTTILKIDGDNVLYEYLNLVLSYYDKKKTLKISSSKLASLTGIPILSIRRFENLQHIPSLKMVCVIAKSVNMTVILK